MVVSGVTQIDLPSCPGDSLQDSKAALPCFVAGPENRLARIAIERLLAADELSACSHFFTPLVLIGPAGSGKSHLAHGIARKFHQLLGSDAVEYFTAVDFGRCLHAAREEGKLECFRERLANLSLLIVEDLQRLPQRTFIQRELRDTIDTLVSAERMVLLTSQQPPATMVTLETGLRDRLASGLTVQLRTPGVEARQKILSLAAAARSVPIDSDELTALAKKVDGPAPQLLRALAELEMAADTGQNVPELRRPVQLKQIIAVVARYYSLTQAALRSPNRRKSLVHARCIVIYLARKLTNLSYAQIGHSLGRRDHTTIMHAQRNIERLVANDPATQQTVDQLHRILAAV